MAEAFTISVRTITAQGAQHVLDAAVGAARARQLALSVAVVDNVGNLVAFLRVDQACVTSVEASIRKARTAASLGAPTKVFEDLLHAGATSLLAFEFISPSQGGVPIRIGGVTVGGIGVSGSTGEVDEEIAQAGAEALTGE